MGFIGDFFLPKHAIRSLGRIAGAALPAADKAGHRPGPRQVVTEFMMTATRASKAIGDRLFQGQPWAARSLPVAPSNLGGLVVLLGWIAIVVTLLGFSWAKLLSGIKHQHLSGNPPPVVAPVKPAPGAGEEPGRGGHGW